MTDKTITSRLDIDKEKWEEIVDFIDEWDNSRRDSDAYYAERALLLAHKFVQTKQEEIQDRIGDVRGTKREIEEVLDA